jgi:ketosteroid isomerase-like protein
MSAPNKAVVQKINEAFARNDVEGFLALCSEDLVWTMVGHETVRGRDAIRKWMASAPAESPRFTIDTVVGEGDFVTVVGDMTMNENGAVVPYAYCDVWRFKGDKPVELNAFVIKTNKAKDQAVRT